MQDPVVRPIKGINQLPQTRNGEADLMRGVLLSCAPTSVQVEKTVFGWIAGTA